MRTFNVELLVTGQITTKGTIKFIADKELDLGNIFRSDITIKTHPQGTIIASTVWTATQDNAYKVALLFIGKMLDVLSIKTDIALNITNSGTRITNEISTVKAVIDSEEFRQCFALSRTLNLSEPTLLRALNWYRKGLYTQDPFDKFLAFWNSVSVVAGKYHNKNERTDKGIINQIWDCFITLWGDDIRQWENIDGNSKWIDENNDIRNNIAHGLIPVEVDYVETVISKLRSVQNVSYRFLTQWAGRQLHRPLI